MKYSNVKTLRGDIKFDSKKEARRYDELTLCFKGKVISSLELQPKFILQEGYSYNSSRIKPIYYVSDFLYKDLERNVWVVEDTKGMKTPVYRLKIKIFIRNRLCITDGCLRFDYRDKYSDEKFLFLETN
jgi:hypothetical protein